MDGEAIVEHIFDVADLDEDGVLYIDEFEDARLAEYGLSFEQCDTNQDGVLALDEYLDLYNAHHTPVEEESI
jgi:Ca2+-binding EF-hand superfamily protein